MNPFDADAAALASTQLEPYQADIEFLRDPGGATYIGRQRVGYPFHLGRTLHSPGDPAGMPTVYLQSCSGGIFEGDDLRIRLAAGAGTALHVTSAASTIVHSMKSGDARQKIEIDAGAGSFFEYLPDPIILFPGAQMKTSMLVRKARDATVILGDTLVLHDPQGESGIFDRLQSETRVHDADGNLMVCDRFRVAGGEFARRYPGITGRFVAQGTLFILCAARPAAGVVAALRSALLRDGVYAGAALLPNQSGAWARILAVDAIPLKAAMFSAWSAARQLLTGAVPTPRRK